MNINELVRKKVIDLGGKNLWDEDLDGLVEVLRKSKVLERLHLSDNQLTLADGKFTDALAQNRSLKILWLDRNVIRIEGAKRLADALKVNKILKQLYLDDNNIGDDGAKYIADALMENESLEITSLDENNIGDEGANSLANCFTVNQNIRKVYLQKNNITDDGAQQLIKALKRNCGIKLLSVRVNPIIEHVEAEIEDLLKDPKRKVPHAQMKHVREEIERKDGAIKHAREEIATLKAALAIKEQRIEMMKTAIRSPMEQLRNIIDPVDLTGDENDPSNKRPRMESTATKSNLAVMHQRTQKMVQIKQEKNEDSMNFDYLVAKKVIDLGGKNFWHKRLSDEDLGGLVEVLRKSEVLEELDLRNNQLTLADGKFTDALANNNTLKYLDLGWNEIGDEGAKRLADALKVNITLKKLNLGYNEIGDDGAKYIANALMENESLEDINLDTNDIDDDGAKSLADCFMDNQSIRKVNLRTNNISDDGAKTLIEALKLNYGIKVELWDQKFDTWSNPISEHVKAEMTKLLDNPKRKVRRSHMKHLRETIVSRDKDIASIQKDLQLYTRQVATQDTEIATLKTELATKDQQIESSKASVMAPIVDLTEGNNEPTNKRPRKESTSALAIIHKQTQKMVQIKQEKNEAEKNLKSVQEEKEVVDANLNDTREDLEDANNLVQQQLLATDSWQGRFDELTNLVLAGQADGAAIAEIRNRPLANGN